MSKFTLLTDELHSYVVANGAREDDALAAVREETAAMGSISSMQIAPDQGALMTLLARLTGARRAIEVGTFTGYSAICIARGLGEGGRLVCCELDPERAATAQRNFERAGVAERIEVRVGPAGETLDALAEEGGEPYDLAFIDADKTGYDAYYERCLGLVRAGGLIIVDNVLQDGRVLDPADNENAQAIVALNAKLREDDARRAGDDPRRRRNHARLEALGAAVRIGIVSKWIASGQAVVARQIRSALDELGHETFVLARPGSGPRAELAASAAAGDIDPVWEAAADHRGERAPRADRRVRGLGPGELDRGRLLRRELPVRRDQSSA